MNAQRAYATITNTKTSYILCHLDFGQVQLIRKDGGIDNGKLYAMKTIKSSAELDHNDQHEICRNELNVILMTHK